MTAQQQLCEWFAYCENPATQLMPHPILDLVPICDSCAERLARIDARTMERRTPQPLKEKSV